MSKTPDLKIVANDGVPQGQQPDVELIEAAVADMVRLSPAEYVAVRKDEAKQLGIGAGELDRLVKIRRKQVKTETDAPTPPPVDMAALRRSAVEIIECDDILARFGAVFSEVNAGEVHNAKLLYLIGTSRLHDRTMHAAIKGPSAAGKSHLRKGILKFFPPESLVEFTSLSEKFLIYYDGEFCHKILSMGEAVATDEQDFQDYLLRELMSEGRLRHSTVQKIGDEIRSITIEKEGPVSFLVTTTKAKLHPENETRMLSLETDDSPEQTERVLAKVAEVEGLNEAGQLIDYAPWHDFQRWLAAGDRRVVVPFAGRLVKLIPAASVRLRRDFGQVIRAIKTHALLHREHRGRDEAGQVVAIEHDYAVIRDLMHTIIAEGSDAAIDPTI
jgi:hypothetical protein